VVDHLSVRPVLPFSPTCPTFQSYLSDLSVLPCPTILTPPTPPKCPTFPGQTWTGRARPLGQTDRGELGMRVTSQCRDAAVWPLRGRFTRSRQWQCLIHILSASDLHRCPHSVLIQATSHPQPIHILEIQTSPTCPTFQCNLIFSPASPST
jgi:hypothetical protein